MSINYGELYKNYTVIYILALGQKDIVYIYVLQYQLLTLCTPYN